MKTSTLFGRTRTLWQKAATLLPGMNGSKCLASFAESVQGFRVQVGDRGGACRGGHRRSDSGRCFSSDFSNPLSMRMHSL